MHAQSVTVLPHPSSVSPRPQLPFSLSCPAFRPSARSRFPRTPMFSSTSHATRAMFAPSTHRPHGNAHGWISWTRSDPYASASAFLRLQIPTSPTHSPLTTADARSISDASALFLRAFSIHQSFLLCARGPKGTRTRSLCEHTLSHHAHRLEQTESTIMRSKRAEGRGATPVGLQNTRGSNERIGREAARWS
ncbi:hypothetical protein OH77DRAFT_465338 [Trametes cingulata]|nr:hypothetical protein OH77DRAFT_465338 [Trametes cingulata]